MNIAVKRIFHIRLLVLCTFCHVDTEHVVATGKRTKEEKEDGIEATT